MRTAPRPRADSETDAVGSGYVVNTEPVRALCRAFDDWAARTPDAVAVTDGDRRVSYAELADRADRLARHLRGRGVGPDDRVGILLGRSAEQMVAVLAVLKAGGAYVPLDPAYPADRLALMRADSRAALVVTGPAHAGQLEDAFVLGRDDAADPPATDLPADDDPDRLGYVIYTSGSTGRPKGVAMRRGALANLVAWQLAHTAAGPGDATAQFASLSFDVSFQEIFATWAGGGNLVLVPEAARRDPQGLLKLLDAERVARLFVPVVALTQLAEAATALDTYPASLKEVITAGEQLRITPAVRRFFAALPGRALHNHYGPSETHVVTAYALAGPPDSWPALPPIGRPIDNVFAQVADDQLRPVADGGAGELVVGGACLARGYLDRPDLTAERFVALQDGERVYRTGDLAKRRPDGEIEYLGRADRQVKVRGFRVEPGEVEAALADHPAVREAVVVAREDAAGGRRLVAYVVPRGERPAADDLRRHLSGRLPDYMVPSTFEAVAAVPLTPSGKVDRDALPAPAGGRPDLGTPFAEPRGATQEAVAAVWRDVLGLDRVGAEDRFADLGGHSLALARVHLKLRDALGIDLPLTDLFRFPTVAALATHLDGTATAKPRAARPRPAVDTDGVAVVGMAGRFPGAATVGEFWQNLCAGVESVTHFTDAELLAAGVPADRVASPDAVKARAVLADPDLFDAPFFGFQPREAAVTDPQHRLFLEACWAALEHAGYDPSAVPGTVGVFAGASLNTYLLNNVLPDRAAVDRLTGAYQTGEFPTLLGNDEDYLATRVAYKLDLRGPAVTVQTACSTSLVAICQAVDAILAGRCDAALAGGVSVSFPQRRAAAYQEGSMVAPDGRCRAFDADSNGTVFGEGVAVVVLKRLSDALADGDTIYAVVKGTAVTNDGAEKVSFLSPSQDGQAAAVAGAIERAGVSAETIGYVEAHGTGTPVGDPIEVAGLTQAFRRTTAATGYCVLGSVKPNVGHLEAAAGVTGFLKAVLALHHKRRPGTLHYKRPNPAIDFPATPFVVRGETADWPSGPTPRRAGVSSTGVGGTNAHVVLEEAPATAPGGPAWPAQLLVVSGRTEAARDAASAWLADHLRTHPDQSLADVGYTSQAGRRPMAFRRAVVADSHADAVAALADRRRVIDGRVGGSAPPVAFLFPGQGSQYPGMGRGLYAAEPAYRAQIDICADLLRPAIGLDLREILHPAPGREDEARRLLGETRYTQPAIFVTGYALAQVWLGWGMAPAAMLGHSVGEFVAACLAGVLSLEDALTLVARRAALVQELPGGVMLAVGAAEDELNGLVTADLALAAVNGPGRCVLAGPAEAVERAEAKLATKNVPHRRLATSHAFHSPMLDPAVGRFRAVVEGVKLSPPKKPFVSCLTGKPVTDSEATDPGYWASQLRATVRFADALAELRRGGHLFLEVGPGDTLTALAKRAAPGRSGPTAVPSLPPTTDPEGAGDVPAMLNAVGRLWVEGVGVDWERFHAPGPRRRVALPTYPFERTKHWIEPPRPAVAEAAKPAVAEPAPAVVPPTPASRADRLLGEAREVLAGLGGYAPADLAPDATFLELGFDSLFLTQAALAVQTRFGVKVAFRDLMEDVTTLRALAEYLDRGLPPDAPQALAPAPVAVSVTGDTASVLARILEGQQRIQAELEALRGRPAAPPPVPPAATPQPAANAPPAATFGPPPASARAGESDWTPRQREFLDALVRRYVARTGKSKRHVQEHRPHHADPRTASGFTRDWKEIVYPLVVERSAGCKLWDIDGNEYVDLLNGFGPDLFGHSPPFVVKAVVDQLSRGYEVGPTPPLAGETAKLVCELTGMDRASFVCTGSEAVYGALRAARTATGRETVVTFARDYHGNFDEVLVRAGGRRAVPGVPGVPPAAVANMVVLDYGTDAALDEIRRRGRELAAVLVEPVQSRRPELQPREFLHKLRAITEETGTVLIFDEVITGFRLHPGGAQAYFGVRADLATYGKVVAGGMPMGVVAGRRFVMDVFDGGTWDYGDDSFPPAGRTFFAGTFVRHPLALAAARASLQHMKDTGPALQRRLNATADRFVAELNAAAAETGLPLTVVNCGSLLFFRPQDASNKATALFFYLLREKGVYILEGFPSYLSTAHTDADLAAVVRAFRDSGNELRTGGFFGPMTVMPPTDRSVTPLTDAQKEIWLAAQRGPSAAAAFIETCTLDLSGRFDPAAFRAAANGVVARHEALRATFGASGEGMTVAPRAADADVPLEDYAGRPDAEAAALAALDDEDRTPFDLAAGPVIRFRVFKLAADRHLVGMSVHHLACDGWAYDVLLKELAALYTAAETGADAKLSPAPSFRRYAADLAAATDGPDGQRALAYWQRRFDDAPPPLDLPADRPRPARRTHAGLRLTVPLGADLTAATRAAAAKSRATPHVWLLAAYYALLHRLTGQTDLVVGTPAAGQARVGEPGLVGHCVEFLPVRAALDPDKPFADLAAAVKRATLDAADHRPFTYLGLLRASKRQADSSRPPLLSATFNIDPIVRGLDFGAAKCRVRKNPRHFVTFDLHVNLVDVGTDYEAEFEFNTDLFDEATVARWVGHFKTLLAGAAADPGQAVGRLPVLSAAERAEVVDGFNRTAADYPRDKCVHDLVAGQAARTPDAVAVEAGDDRLTYAELDARANRLAHHLRALGVGPDAAVGVCVERSVEMVVTLLAVWKAGGAYLPLDPDLPPARLKLYLDDTAAPVVVTETAFVDRLPPHNGRTVRIDADRSEIAARPADPPPPLAGPRNLACLIYTSGSTGTPNGVATEHRGLVNLIWGMRGGPAPTADDVVAACNTVSFDIHHLEFWPPLCAGARVAVLPRGISGDGPRLAEALDRVGATVLPATPATFRLLLTADWAGRPGLTAICGGEAMAPDLAARLAAKVGTLWNIYGPTETTVYSTIHKVAGSEKPVPIGRPVANTRVYILDRQRQPVPVGCTGELYVGGDGVARGYLNRPGLTANRFLPDPVRPGGRVYKTGDLGRWLPDGRVECLGRIDFQVKLNGHRIELGEVEAALAAFPGAAAAAAKVWGSPPQLAGYVVPRPGAARDAEPVRRFVRDRLPAYMVPGRVEFVDALPLSPNGKVDRRALPEPDPAVSGRPAVAPRTDVERDILAVWAEVLGRTGLGVTDDFFDLGGTSLQAADVVARVRQRLGFAVPLGTLYEGATAEKMAAVVRRGLLAAADQALVPLNAGGDRPPVFMVPGAGGHVFVFRKLARRLGPDQPVFGLKAMTGLLKTPKSFEELAAGYAREIVAARPAGPYLLAGYSQGGLVALEIALQLRAAGHAVPLLVIFDAAAPGYPPPLSAVGRLRHHLRILAHKDNGGLGRFVRDRARNVWDRAARGLGLRTKQPAADRNTASQRWIQAVGGALEAAVPDYRPRAKFDGTVVLFKSEQPMDVWQATLLTDPLYGWAKWAAKPVELRMVPRGHYELFHEANTEQLAAQLTGVIDRAVG
jgi:amino acid adenylation domain-containing protein